MEELLAHLDRLGMQLLFGIDATHLHERFTGQRLHRIYFNFPYTSESVTPGAPSDTARMLKHFFKSAARVL